MPKIHADLIRDGIQGDLYYKDGTEGSGKAMIILGHSFGRYKKNTRRLARAFAGMGIPSLGLAYWKEPGLSGDLSKIPVEYVGEAVNWLHKKGFPTVGVYGISKGAEFALVSASLLPEINFVVAVSPFDYVLEGQTFLGTSSNSSSWSFKGRELPWVPWNENLRSIAATSLLTGQLDMRARYRDALRFASERSVIKAENIKGPVLLLTARDDSVWAGNEAATRIMARLRAEHFPYFFEHVDYRCASHLLLPYARAGKFERMLFRNARRKSDKYSASRKHAAWKIRSFVHKV